MPLGDSITEGFAVNGGYRLPFRDLLAPRLAFTFVGSRATNSIGLDRPNHEGHGGWTIADFIGEDDERVEGVAPILPFTRDADPDVVLLLLGVNDGAVGEAEFARRYRLLLDGIYTIKPKVKIVFMEVLPATFREAMLAQSHAAALTVVREYRLRGKPIALVDPSAAYDPETMSVDGLHPNAAGFAVLARLFESGLDSLPKS